MPSAVLHAMVVIGLARGGVFPHLTALYSPLYIPASVRQEVIGTGAAELAQAVGSWLHEVSPSSATDQRFARLRLAADRSLAVTAEQGANHVLSDDGVVRRQAIALGFTCLGTPQLVVLMKHHGCIHAVEPVLDRMRQQGFGIDDQDYRQALIAAGE